METYKIELWLWWESVLDSLLEAVNVAILFKIHFILMLGSLCLGAPFVVYLEHFQYVE